MPSKVPPADDNSIRCLFAGRSGELVPRPFSEKASVVSPVALPVADELPTIALPDGDCIEPNGSGSLKEIMDGEDTNINQGKEGARPLTRWVLDCATSDR